MITGDLSDSTINKIADAKEMQEIRTYYRREFADEIKDTLTIMYPADNIKNSVLQVVISILNKEDPRK